MILSPSELEQLSLDEILALYSRIRQVLIKKVEGEKHRLEGTLSSLRKGWGVERTSAQLVTKLANLEKSPRRKYPPVIPKYRNPADYSETWAGRGKKPRWVVAQLKAGKKIEDFIIKKRHTRK
jgi:DNA-binding protein H-NS